jgi:hypothetical protein
MNLLKSIYVSTYMKLAAVLARIPTPASTLSGHNAVWGKISPVEFLHRLSKSSLPPLTGGHQ